jgi:predicted nucleic acid-binding protein
VAAERQGKNVKQLLRAVKSEAGENEIAVSVLTLLELAHGVARANTPERRETRQRFLQELMSVVPLHLVTAAIALRADDIDGQSQAKGVRIPLSDLLIGVTALELGYGIATHNVRHFQLIPNLSIVKL